MSVKHTSLNQPIDDDLKIRVDLYRVIYVLAIPIYIFSHFISIQLGMKESLVFLAVNLGTAIIGFLISRFKNISFYQSMNLFTAILAIHSLTAIYKTHLNNYHQISIFGCLILLVAGMAFLSSTRRILYYSVIFSTILATGCIVFTHNYISASYCVLASALLVPALSLHHNIYDRLALRTFRLNSIFNNTAAGIIQVDQVGKILQTNLKFQEMTEYNEKDLQALTLPQLCLSDEVDPLKTFLYNAGLEFAPRIETRIQTKFGKFIWIRMVASNQPGAGFSDNLILLALDISAEKKLNELSHFQKQILTMFARKVPFKYIISEVGKFLSIHTGGLPVVISVVKDNKPEVVGSFNLPDNILSDLNRSADSVGHGNISHAIETKTLHVVESIADSKDWTQFRKDHPKSPLAACWSFPFFADTGSTAGVIEIYKYTTGAPTLALINSLEVFSSLAGMAVMVHNSEEMQRVYTANLTQTAKLASLGEMAAGIAHEINNPMTIIQGRAEQIKGAIKMTQVDLAKIDSIADNITKSVHRVAKIIKGLRAFARFNADMDFAPVNVNDLIAETLDLCGQRFKTNNVKLSIKFANETSAVLSRGTQLSQVLLNLFNNAYDAIVELPDKWIEVKAIETVEFVQITVTDCGPGIPAPVAEKLFQPFFTTKGVDKGTGLGLSIAHGIIADHKGRIYIDKTSKNTCFVIELPRLPNGLVQKSA